MDEKPTLFGYRGSYRSYLAAIAGLGFLALVEMSVMLLILFFVIQNPTAKIITGSVLALLLGIPVFILTRPLRTQHQLWDTYFLLHYGELKLKIPRDRITSARAVNLPVAGFDTLKARQESATNRLKACFSKQGQVLLTIDPPIDTPGFTNVKEVLVNVDDAAALIEELQKTSRQGKTAKPEPSAKFIETDSPVSPDGAGGEFLLRTANLSRSFGDLQVVKNLNLAIHAGEIYGFLGCNGAGKTTTIKMLTGLLEPGGGTVEIAGIDMWKNPEEAKKSIGYVPDRALLYDRLTGREYLEFIAQLRGIPVKESHRRIDHLLDMMELSPRADGLCGKYSFGMKQKLSLAAALMHQPPLLILDEPLNGLDPRSSRQLKNSFKEFASKGISIFMSTHDLATAESVCDRVGILHKGQIIAEGSARQLREMLSADDLEAVFLQLTSEESNVGDQR